MFVGYALRFLYIDKICSDSCVWLHGIFLLPRKQNELAIAAGALAVLFQPLVKFALGRFVWNVVDVVVAIALVVLVFVEHKNNKERKLWKK